MSNEHAYWVVRLNVNEQRADVLGFDFMEPLDGHDGADGRYYLWRDADGPLDCEAHDTNIFTCEDMAKRHALDMVASIGRFALWDYIN